MTTPTRHPFAYLFTYDYGDSYEVHPTLDSLVDWLKQHNWPLSELCVCEPVTACYADGEQKHIPLTDYIVKGEVDMAAVAAEVDRCREESVEREKRFNEEWRRLHPDTGPVTATGSCPYHYGDRDQQIAQAAERAQWRWKDSAPLPPT